MRELFPPEEMRERFNFTSFFFTYFRCRRDNTNDFLYPFDIEYIYNLYKSVRPDTMLSEADLEMYFTINGVMTERGVYIDLNHDNEALIPINVREQLIPHMLTKRLIAASQDFKEATIADLDSRVTLRFLRLYTKRAIKQDKEMRVKTSSLFELYAIYCVQYTLKPLGRKAFMKMVNKHVNRVKKGYCDGISGVNYFDGSIPDKQDWPISVQNGLGIFKIGNRYLDNEDRVLHLDANGNPTDAMTIARIQSRKEQCFYVKPPTAPIGQKECENTEDADKQKSQSEGSASSDGLHTGTNSQISDVSSDGAKERDIEQAAPTSPKRSIGRHEEDDSGTKECYPIDTSDAEPSGLYWDDYAVTKGELRSHFGPATKSSEPVSSSGQNTNGESDDSDEGISGEPTEDFEEVITTKEIFAALKVAYKLAPTGTWDKKTMNSYLVSMDVDYSAEDLWDDFMKWVGAQ